MHFEVTRTVSAPQTIYELTANLRPGRHTFTWHPHWSVGARTYLVRITATDGAGNRRTYGADNAQRAGSSRPRSCASSASTPASRARATSLELGAARDRDRRGDADPADVPRRSGGRRATHSDTIMNGVPVNQPVTIPWSARRRRATLNFADRPLADRRLLRQADRERRPDRLRAVRRPADDARSDEPRRRRDADEHVAGLQLPRRGRQRLGRHVVREGRAEHCRARPHVHPPRRPAAVAQVRVV